MDDDLEPFFEAVDLRGLDDQEATRQHAAIETREAGFRFDLSEPPLVRAVLVLRRDAATLVLTIHHILADAWSISIAASELGELYDAYAHGREPQLEPLPIQYADFAIWQRNSLDAAALDAGIEYWQRTLEGAPRLTLPIARLGAAQTGSLGVVTERVDDGVTAALRDLARAERTTMFSILVAAFSLVLSRYAAEDDIVVGTPVAGRPRPELEKLIGCFVNMLAIRVRLGQESTHRELVRQIRETALDAYAHQDVPIERVVEALRGDRREPNPIFDIILVVQNAPQATFSGGELAPRFSPWRSGNAKYALSLTVWEGADVALDLSFDESRFAHDDAALLVRHIRAQLERIAAEPDAEIWKPLLDASELRTVLDAWATSPLPPLPAATLADLVRARAEQTPDAIAVASGDSSVTCAAFARRVSALACRLRESGVSADGVVAVCLEPSIDAYVAFAAAGAAGAAFLPLDPKLPHARLALMIEDSGATAVVARTPADLPSVQARLVLPRADDPGGGDGAPRRRARTVEVVPDQLAYVMYTSGSTGRPKGVAISHRSIVNRLAWMDSALAIDGGDRVLQRTPLGFDPSVWEIFWPLGFGGTIVVCPDEIRRDPRLVTELVSEQRASIVRLEPSILRPLVDFGLVKPLTRSVRAVWCGGESLPPTVLDAYVGASEGRTPLHNAYGPTEATISVTVETCELRADGRVPIGRPIAGACVFVLDPRGKPAPVGVPGEIWIGGPALARGYHGHPAATAERFVPDGFGGRGRRLYRTGDRGRWLADGSLEFLGRIDNQLKIRGYRVEPGEIEATLAAHPSVQRAVVVAAAADGGAATELVAYVCGDTPDAAAVRRFLSERLPDYMLPDVVVMDELPLTPSGKVDRRRLSAREHMPAPKPSPPGDGSVTARVAAVFADVLRVREVGNAEDFFDLGGHSLRAMQVAARIEQLFETRLTLPVLFERRTPRALAEWLAEAATAAGNGGALVARPREEREPLSFIQERLWFLDQLEPGNPAYTIPLAQRLRGPLDPVALERALNDLVVRHESLRTTFHIEDGTPYQRVSRSVPVRLELDDLFAVAPDRREQEAQRLAVAESERPFDLAHGPLLRARLIRLAEDDHVLLLSVHHVVADGWSMAILFEELTSLYRAHTTGEALRLPAVALQYSDFVRWQRDRLRSDRLACDLEYWSEHLTDAPARLDLPHDHPRQRRPTYSGGHLSRVLPDEISRRLADVARAADATPFMAMLAMFAATLARYSGQWSVVVGTPVAGRTHPATERLVGCFLNTLPLHVRVAPQTTLHDLLRDARRVALDGFAHQEAPFDRVVAELDPQRDLATSPIFQAMLAYQNVPARRLVLSAVEAKPFHVHGARAKLDVTLTVWDDDGRLALDLEYSKDLFEHESARRWLQHLDALVSEWPAQPGLPLRALPIAGGEAHDELVAHARPRDLELHEPVHAQVAARAREAPDAPAVVDGDHTITFGAVDRAANGLARRLVRAGVRRGDVVAIVMRRSVEAVVAILGTHRAGAAYLPLDPTYPPQRLEPMLEAARPVALLVREDTTALPGKVALEILVDPQNCRAASPPPGRAPHLDDDAFILFTSGSTGGPKGVVGTQRAVANRVLEAHLPFGRSERGAYRTSLNFGDSIWEMFAPLVRGAPIVVVREEIQSDPAAIIDVLRAERATRIILVPSLLRALLDAADDLGQALPDLRSWISSGEHLPVDLVARLASQAPSAQLVNVYGASEAYDATATVVEPSAHGPVPVGSPLANVSLAILDQQQYPLPLGATGELYVGGACLAHGYLGSPGLTATRFVPAPDGPPGLRLYRTGDLARWLPDGRLAIAGRVDRQLKVRGHRIEAEEVEALLRAHADVVDAAVAVAVDERGEASLVAYIVLVPGAAPSPKQLRRALAALPPAFLPSHFVTLDALPRTPSGKIDTHALPPPERARPAVGSVYVEPQTSLEATIAAAWSATLGVDRVGVDDDFFELGGHSLIAPRLVAELERALARPIELRFVFEAPTVALQAATLGAASAARSA